RSHTKLDCRPESSMLCMAPDRLSVLRSQHTRKSIPSRLLVALLPVARSRRHALLYLRKFHSSLAGKTQILSSPMLILKPQFREACVLLSQIRGRFACAVHVCLSSDRCTKVSLSDSS